MTCAACGAALPAAARFCPGCGAAVPKEPPTAVGGDQIVVGTISGSSGVAIGRGASARVTQGPTGDELGRLFARIYEQIERRPADPNADPTELAQTVKRIEAEAAKGPAANPDRVDRWLRTLAEVAPDLLQVTASALVNPAAGVAAAVQAIATRVRASSTASE